jgi:hypothetical protein
MPLSVADEVDEASVLVSPSAATAGPAADTHTTQAVSNISVFTIGPPQAYSSSTLAMIAYAARKSWSSDGAFFMFVTITTAFV